MADTDSAFRIDPEASVLVAIDLQRDLLVDSESELHDWAQPVVKSVARLVDWCRRIEIPIIWVRVVRRRDGADSFNGITDLSPRTGDRPPKRLIEGTAGVELAPPLEMREDDFHLEKPRVSAFYGTKLEVYVRRLEASTLLFAGVYTHMGVEASVRGAYDRDLQSVVVADACGAPSESLHRHAIGRTLPAMAVVRDSASLSAKASG